MTDRPILFSGPMVRALLAGTKTQTRRVLKPQPPAWATFCQQPTMLNVLQQWVPSGLWAWSEAEQQPPRELKRWPVDANGDHYWLNPRFAVGDRLYVREAWKTHAAYDDISPAAMGGDEAILYEADGAHQTWGYPAISKIGRFRQGMHMPRWASRLTLTVIHVRVQRLQEIGHVDAAAEGCLGKGTYPGGYEVTPRDQYRELWDSLNAPRGFGWDSNPWVVAVSFTVERRNIDA
jgi:hypothetical protein